MRRRLTIIAVLVGVIMALAAPVYAVTTLGDWDGDDWSAELDGLDCGPNQRGVGVIVAQAANGVGSVAPFVDVSIEIRGPDGIWSVFKVQEPVGQVEITFIGGSFSPLVLENGTKKMRVQGPVGQDAESVRAFATVPNNDGAIKLRLKHWCATVSGPASAPDNEVAFAGNEITYAALVEFDWSNVWTGDSGTKRKDVDQGDGDFDYTLGAWSVLKDDSEGKTFKINAPDGSSITSITAAFAPLGAHWFDETELHNVRVHLKRGCSNSGWETVVKKVFTPTPVMTIDTTAYNWTCLQGESPWLKLTIKVTDS